MGLPKVYYPSFTRNVAARGLIGFSVKEKHNSRFKSIQSFCPILHLSAVGFHPLSREKNSHFIWRLVAYSPELIESRGDTSMEFGPNYAQFYIHKLYILYYTNYIRKLCIYKLSSDKSQSRVSTRLISSRWIRCKQISSLRGSICNINLFLSIDSYLPFFFPFDLRHLSRILFQFQKLNLALNYHTFSRHKWREGRGEEEKYIYYYKIIYINVLQNYIRKLCMYKYTI